MVFRLLRERIRTVGPLGVVLATSVPPGSEGKASDSSSKESSKTGWKVDWKDDREREKAAANAPPPPPRNPFRFPQSWHAFEAFGKDQQMEPWLGVKLNVPFGFEGFPAPMQLECVVGDIKSKSPHSSSLMVVQQAEISRPGKVEPEAQLLLQFTQQWGKLSFYTGFNHPLVSIAMHGRLPWKAPSYILDFNGGWIPFLSDRTNIRVEYGRGALQFGYWETVIKKKLGLGGQFMIPLSGGMGSPQTLFSGAYKFDDKRIISGMAGSTFWTISFVDPNWIKLPNKLGSITAQTEFTKIQENSVASLGLTFYGKQAQLAYKIDSNWGTTMVLENMIHANLVVGLSVMLDQDRKRSGWGLSVGMSP